MEKKLVLVTGASRGLGKEIAFDLARAGMHIIVNYANNREDAEVVAASIHREGGEACVMRANVTDEADVQSLAEQIQRVYGRQVDVLVNNATGPQPMLSLEQSEWSDYLDQLTFFVKAPLVLVKSFLPYWKKRHSGNIINIGSEVVQLGNPVFSSYVTAKAAMIGMTRSWANELGPYGITVNLIAPGWVPVERHRGTDRAELNAYAARVPLRRVGEPSDIAAAVTFLASGRAGFITGQCLAVNGGNTFGI